MGERRAPGRHIPPLLLLLPPLAHAAPNLPSGAAVMDLWLATSLALILLYVRRRRRDRRA